jgi:hypothetical protein
MLRVPELGPFLSLDRMGPPSDAGTEERAHGRRQDHALAIA